jgi:hypothetical protein
MFTYRGSCCVFCGRQYDNITLHCCKRFSVQGILTEEQDDNKHIEGSADRQSA